MSTQPRSRLIRPSVVLIALFVPLILGGCKSLGADTTLPKRAITIYAGDYTDDKLAEDILVSNNVEFQDSTLTALAYSQTFHRFWDSGGQWEWEGQVGKHWGLQDHWEFNGLVALRWMRFPWSKSVRTSVAVGEGLSYATEIPPLELASHTNEGATKLLNYVLIELAAGLPSMPAWDLVFRVHHRSGVFGIFDGVDGGSNVLAFGLKYRF